MTQTVRQCHRCRVEYPATPEFFLRDKSRILGIAYECRSCHSDRKRGRDNRPDRYSKLSREQKRAKQARQRKYYSTEGGRAAVLASVYRKIDKRVGVSCDLTGSWVLENIVSQPCFYCETTEDPRGCDRIDNTSGHTKANVVPCCRICNVARMDNFTHSEMKILGAAIAHIRRLRRDTSTTEAGNEAHRPDFSNPHPIPEVPQVPLPLAS
jgi:hypothetical protein